VSNISGSSGGITVVVPTYNRLDTLRLCLKSLETQTITRFSVIVVNDGSTDGTKAALADILKTSPLELRVIHQENAGPARARNIAIEQISTPLCLLIGDDILAAPGLLEAHMRFHHANPDLGEVGLGWTKWDEIHQCITPFMSWYEKIQFSYGRLTAGYPPTWQHFYTSNLSCKTNLLKANRFDEGFKAAAWEDIELGFRLSQSGKATVTFLPDAIATHVHPTTFSQAIKRMQTLGKWERVFHQIWPQARVLQNNFKSRLCALLAKQPLLLSALAAMAQHIRPGKIHVMLLRSYSERGYLEANK